MTPNIFVLPDSSQLAQAAAERFIEIGRQAIDSRGRFSVSLSGGSTPRALYSLLAKLPMIEKLDWSRVDFFWGDERCVPPAHPDSDYRMAYESLLRPIESHAPVIYRIQGELEPAVAAQKYSDLLKSYFEPDTPFSFDLLLLGMGDDGRTASLFPGTSPIHETRAWVKSHFVPKLNAWRITLTPAILNLSRHVVFLVSGEAKAKTLRRVLEGPFVPDELPSQIIKPAGGELDWYIDQDAARNLKQ